MVPQSDYIARQMQKDDPFVKELFKELDTRLKAIEERDGDTLAEPMTRKDAALPIIVTALIVLYFVYAIASH